MLSTMLAATLGAGVLAGCGAAGAPVTAEPEAEEYFETEDYEYDDYAEDTEYYEEEPEEEYDETGDLTDEEIVELARIYSGAPLAELDQVMDNGYLYIHLYEDQGDHTATIDWYEIDPVTLKGTDFEGNPVDLSGVDFSDAKGDDVEGDAGEGVAIADGEYVTDDEYTGDLSSDGKTMTITTALYEFVNSPSPSYPKQTYVINVADSCKCVEVQEQTTESSFFDKLDLIGDFLNGTTGLPITLVFKNNELVEIQFSS